MTPAHRRQIEELYQAARDPAKRAGVLAAADQELRSEVEPLLAMIHRRRRFSTSPHEFVLLTRILERL